MTSTNTTITPPGTPPVKPRHRGRKILFGILAALALIVIGSVAAGSGGSHPAAAPSAGVKSNPASQSTGSAVARIGDKARDGKFEFTVVKVTHAKSVGDTQYGLGETAQGRFTIMTLKVTNIGNRSQSLADSSQYVYDAAGHKYSASSAADIYLSGANGQSSTWLNDIDPGNTVVGKIAFDMPAGAKAVKMELHDSMFSGGVIVHVNSPQYSGAARPAGSCAGGAMGCWRALTAAPRPRRPAACVRDGPPRG